MVMNLQKYPHAQKSRNLVQWCRHLDHETMDASFASTFSFRDMGSISSICKNVKTAPGPDECFVLDHSDSRLMFEKLCGLKIQFEDCSSAEALSGLQLYNSMNHYRSHIEEHFCFNGHTPPPIRGKCQMYYSATNILRVDYELWNTSQATVSMALELCSQTSAGAVDEEIKGENDGFTVAQTHRVAKHFRAYAHLRALQSMGALSIEGREVHWGMGSVQLKAKELFKASFEVHFSTRRPPKVEASTPRQSLEDRLDWWEQRYAKAGLGLSVPSEEPKGVGEHLENGPQRNWDGREEDLLLKASGILGSLQYKNEHEGDQHWNIHPGKAGVACTFFWDSAFTLLGLAHCDDVEVAKGTIRTLLGGVREDGAPPNTYTVEGYAYLYQMPILVWGMSHFFEKYPDDDFLQECYPTLKRMIEHWYEVFEDEATGLVATPPGCPPHDDALRWMTEMPQGWEAEKGWDERVWGETRPDFYFSVDTNTHLYMDTQALARMAKHLGESSDAQRFEVKAQALGEAIKSHLFCEQRELFFDKHRETGEFNGLVYISQFYPIYAGLVDEAMAQSMCRRELLDPDRFYSTLPFPVQSQAEETFQAGGFLFENPNYPGALIQHAYWRGRAWPHMSYWAVCCLEKAGLQQEADEARSKILEALAKSESIHECYDPLTGYGNGHGEFMWSAAAVLALLHRDYRREAIGSFG